MSGRLDPARVEALFDDLAERTPEEASRRLAEACPDEPELVAAVNRLLARDRALPANFLAPSPELFTEAMRERIAAADTVADRAGMRASAAKEPLSLHAATRVGRFSLLRKLGEGGMGVVYLGYDDRLDRRAAIKVLHHEIAGSERLLREAQALAKLSHPNVVPVYEVGEHEGRVFLAMEFVDGPTLRSFLAEARTTQAILAVFVEAGRGLSAAHQAGIVHRDFKPDNVLVGSDGRPRVVDFGIAGSADRRGDQSAARLDPSAIGSSSRPFAAPLTHTGSLLGTPAFMSPEQFRGEHATPASDQFSFCVALYEAVYRAKVFEGRDLAELSKNVLAGAMKPPPKDRDVPARLAPILTRGLATKPADRYRDMASLLEALGALLPSHPDLDLSRTRRPRWVVGAVMLVIALGLTVVVSVRGEERQLASIWDLVGFGVLTFVVGGAAVALLWKRLAKNLAGRRFAVVFMAGLVLLVVQRLVGALVGLSVRQVITLDILHVASVLAFAALFVETWFALLGALGLVALVVAVEVPAWAVSAFADYTLLVTVATVVLLPRAGRSRT